MMAIEELEFEDFLPRLREFLEGTTIYLCVAVLTVL